MFFCQYYGLAHWLLPLYTDEYMVKRPEYDLGYHSPEDDDEDESKDKKTPRRLGSVVRYSVDEKTKSENIKESSKRSDSEEEPDKRSAKNESERSSESEAVSIEELKRTAVKDQLAAEIATLEEQAASAEEGSPERVEAEAALAFARAVDHRVDNPDLEVDPVIEAEYQKRMAEISDEEIAENLEELIEFDELEPLEIEHDTAPIAPIPPVTPPPRPRTPRAAPVTPPPPPPFTPPITTVSTGPTGGIGGAEVGSATLSPSPPVETNLYRPSSETTTERSNKAGAFMLGGVLGYMLGRRGGRKRTEAKLQPEINRLDTEVKKTQSTLANRESEIKRASREKQEQEFKQELARRQRVNEEVSERRNQKVAHTPVTEILRQTVTSPVESPGKTTPEKQQSQASAAEIKRAKQLSTPELLKTAEHLFVSGVSVRRLYETNQIDRSGLVEIVQTALRGGNIKEAFEKVELGAERQRERAREFRHDPAFNDSSDDSVQTDAPTAVPSRKSSPTVAELPNVPSTQSLEPVAPQSTTPKQADSEELEPLDLDELNKPQTAQLKVVAVVALVLCLILIALLFSL